MAFKKVTFDERDIRKILEPDTPAKRWRRLTLRTAKQVVFLAVLFGFFFLAINSSAYLARFKYSILAQKPTQEEQPPEAVEPVPIKEVANYSPEIIIEKIGIQAPMILNVGPDQTLNELRNGVIHYIDTALPGQVGNTVVVGHSSDFPWSPGNYKTVFALLDKLTVGDKIILPYRSQRYTYEVVESKVVKPDDLSVLQKTEQPRLTLITCYPVGTTQKRLIVSAKLIDGQVLGVQAAEPVLQSLPKAR